MFYYKIFVIVVITLHIILIIPMSAVHYTSLHDVLLYVYIVIHFPAFSFNKKGGKFFFSKKEINRTVFVWLVVTFYTIMVTIYRESPR